MKEAQSIGHLIDDLDFTQWPAPEEEVLGAVVLLKVRGPDGDVALRSMWSDDLGWLERVGMHTVAAQSEVPSSDHDDEWLDDDYAFGSLHSVDTGPEAIGDTRPGARQDAHAARGSRGLDQHNG